MDKIEKKKIKVDRSVSRKLLKIAGLLRVLAWICLVLGVVLVYVGFDKRLDFYYYSTLIESGVTLFMVVYILKGLSVVVELSECKKAIIEDEYKIEDLY